MKVKELTLTLDVAELRSLREALRLFMKHQWNTDQPDPNKARAQDLFFKLDDLLGKDEPTGFSPSVEKSL